MAKHNDAFEMHLFVLMAETFFSCVFLCFSFVWLARNSDHLLSTLFLLVGAFQIARFAWEKRCKKT